MDRANRHCLSRGWSTQDFVSDLQQTLAEAIAVPSAQIEPLLGLIERSQTWHAMNFSRRSPSHHPSLRPEDGLVHAPVSPDFDTC